tara:strand:+ start:1091 stop:1519 length:429 start_codon:yes stop_codon:yes gene_type:complete
MEFTIKHKEIQYTDAQIREVIDKYNVSRKKMREYTKNRYQNYKKDLHSDDPEKKAKAEEFIGKLRENALNHYNKEAYQKDYQENKTVIRARYKYYYYKKNDKMDTFIKSDKFADTREILLKDDSSRRTAKEKYPELFQSNDE